MTVVGSFPSRPIIHHGNTRVILTPTITTSLLLLLLTRPAIAQPSPTTSPDLNDQPTISRSTAVVILILITAFFFMGFTSLYIRHCSDDDSATTRPDPNGSIFLTRRAARGLDPEVIKTFPIFDYAAVKELKMGKHALECAVCITEFEDDDELRLLPHCDHVFHPDCIDAWLAAHSSCPVCRANLHAPPPDFKERESPPPAQQPPQPSSRTPTMRQNASFGRVWGKIARSLSTGHVAVKQWENLERFRLRLPEEVRKEVMSGKLSRANSLVVLQRETSSRRGNRTGFGEGSSRGRPRRAWSDRWIFSFSSFSRALSFKPNYNNSRQGSLRGSIQDGSVRLPV